MEIKKIPLSGNEAIARGFYEAGGIIAASYPGSPTVEIIETLEKRYKDDVYAEFSVNEKVALEVAIGGSFVGARSMATMKHVGVNIALDPLMTFTQVEVDGGILLVTGDDPGMASSQNEQDNRNIGKFANMPILDPSDSQEAKDFTKLAFEISEKFNTPVMLRITSKLCHSRSPVILEDRLERKVTGFTKDPSRYSMIPPHTFKSQYTMMERIKRLSEYAEHLPINHLEEVEGSEVLFITSGLMYHHLKELGLNYSIYKLGMIYPLPINKLKEIAKNYKKIVVIEEMSPFIENELKINGFKCIGKEFFPFTGQLTIEDIEIGLINAGILMKDTTKIVNEEKIVDRPPMFCAGCPHRPIFDILKKAKVDVIGDIGCYSMGVLYPFEVLKSIISMGASIGITKGMKKALSKYDINNPLIAVIGDGTFFHSGITGFINLLHNLDPNENMTFIILDNGTTAMTGGQYNASSGNFYPEEDMKVKIDQLLKTIGFENIHVIDQFRYNESKKIINDEIKKHGISIIITTRPCALRSKIKNKPFYVNPEICIGCRSCVKTNCPPIKMISYPGFDKLKSSIDADMCVGCSICAQVCPVKAIRIFKEGEDANG
ncbi:indolepyruvate ferredoxin oxidoreductase alpha subunit [Anaerobranca californiensis DSM 14826]|jgi:indolepyruvate ferredoxin oxidoreductase alpha subunit|uniref:Indolepyruvate oxidoreductase subunit IorA n=1 Tax=Anaerobranca californiensis DSM 14826 TaxID=1120989 RepID=A0A1M6LLT6_9FIRM|nr:thiamine pyrophosphate-dependent enzyme [Anaerobranca californiensis]SHJ72042.1 indolepyruvate ferredoxin oxidoreductase alpha subunit [Anaerobranca californiensis DSM 14826]